PSNPPNFLGFQGFFDTTVAIDPKAPVQDALGRLTIVVYLGGQVDTSHNPPDNSIISGDPDGNGGYKWTYIARNTGAVPHSDFHASGFDPTGKLLVGSDGGIWRLENTDRTNPAWTDLNGNLNTITLTGFALDPTNPNVVYGASQDNGTEKFSDNLAWQETAGG